MINTPSHPTGRPRGASDAAAALKGANLAFNKTKPKPIPPPKPASTPRTIGASLVAAATADSSRSISPIQRQYTGTSVATSTTLGGVSDVRDKLSPFLASSPSNASHLSPHTRLDPKSPSYIAATLAASRSTSPSPQPQHTTPSALTPAQLNQLQQLQNSARRGRRGSLEEEDDAEFPDETSIPRTGHLITMFERGEDVDPVKKSGGEVKRPKQRPLTPEREMSPTRAKAARMASKEDDKATVKAKPKLKPRPAAPDAAQKEVAEHVTPQAKTGKSSKPRPITPTPVIPRETPSVQEKQPALKPVKPPVSPKNVVQKPADPEETRKPQSRTKQAPKGAPESLSVSSSTRVPITRKTVQPKAPPAAPEPRRSRPKNSQAPSSPPAVMSSSTGIASPKPERPAVRAKMRPPTPPQPRGSAGTKVLAPPPLVKPKGTATVYSQGQGELQEGFFPRPASAPRPSTADTSSSNDTFVSASSGQTAVPEPAGVDAPPRRTPSAMSTPGRLTNESPTRTTPRRTPMSSTTSLPLNSLSSAIMAGSLAAARLTPSNTGNSTLSPPPLPNRTKSPRFRQTLRHPPSKSDDEDKIRKKRHHRASKKHSHAEGARKRWRDEITTRERRRYEAVWASNRGVLLTPFAPQALQQESPPPPDAADCVINVVAREIWRRSRLPQEELAEVWDVVDRQRRGLLNKQEFVVGMWLIDQRLRGRKIPQRVSASVWDSAQGVKVLSPKAKK
ncbi:Increased rDNA silencing protein 4 [Colletotrichum orbiculare MAFF 240422]|uniref:Increased rDNA silencing protein 4 n=1 Tax=Colletotrichum orbiculare (strain 104-T / ATCC 96160 / CBS 514.97 / LARS 414 / MAFF 240422) TaxID=1213857 RepID=N4VV89_COLOR|nr:Increased rDNA silencing protein 4 [Colletotrichum orbiculare MAFF 240422]